METTPNLNAYAYADPDVGDGPHAYEVQITVKDRARWRAFDERDRSATSPVRTRVNVGQRRRSVSLVMCTRIRS